MPKNNFTPSQSNIKDFFKVTKVKVGEKSPMSNKKYCLSLNRKNKSDSVQNDDSKKRKLNNAKNSKIESATGATHKTSDVKHDEDKVLSEICDNIIAYVDKDASFDGLETEPTNDSLSESISGKEFSDLHVSNLKHVIVETLKHPENSLLLTEQHKKHLNDLLALTFLESKLCIRLFFRLNTWHIYSKFVTDPRLRLELTTEQAKECRLKLLEKNMILADYSKENIGVLLNLLSAASIKNVASKFGLKNTSKTILVEELVKKTKNKSTLLFGQSSNVTNKLMNEIKVELGECVMLNPEFRAALIRTQFLFSISQRFLLPHDLHNVLSNMQFNSNLYPSYRVDHPKIFQNIEQFNAYEHFYLLADKIMNAANRKNKPSPEEPIDIGLTAYSKFKDFLTEEKYLSWHEFAHQLPSFLKKFSLGELLTSIIWYCFDSLKKFVQDKYKFSSEIQANLSGHVKIIFGCEKMTYGHLYEILKTLSNQSFYKQSRKNEWAEEMSIVLCQMNQDDEAAEVLISALEKENSEIAKLNISDRAKKLIASKKNINSELVAKIKVLIKPFESDIPCITIRAVEAFENTTGNKKRYKSIHEGEINFLSVEQVALDHYKTQEGFEYGTHSEQAQIVTIFGLLFWDIIYDYHVPNTFITCLQTQPLDMKSSAFFINRQAKIEERLQRLKEWCDEELFMKIDFAKQVENTCSLLNPLFCENPDVLKDFIKCIDRNVLSKIMERLARNFGMTRAGFPDLIVWSAITKKCKFVEVKSQNDVLSNKQILWLKYLNSIGANAEVCSVHSIGAKRKSIAKTFSVHSN